MFEAELSNKLPEIYNREDYLTSCIFGALKYIPPQKALIQILKNAINYIDTQKTCLNDLLKEIEINLDDIEDVEYIFWNKSGVYGEPDLIIIFKTNKSSFMIPIEIKYYSQKHGEGEDDQLYRYYISLINKDSRQTYSDSRIKDFEGEVLCLIYITQFSAESEINESVKIIRKKIKSAPKNLIYHLYWNNIIEIIEDLIKSEDNEYNKEVLTDIWKILMYKNLNSFSGFNKIKDDEYLKDFYKKYFIFFDNPDRKKGFEGFKYSNVNLNYTKNIFLGV